jgi:HPt (histidine-containing phosphotransfer) domain-containing protein
MSDSGFDSGDPVAAAIARFHQRYPARIDEIEAAWKAGDYAAAETASHRLKGAGGTFGMEEASTIAYRLERAFAENRLDGVAADIAALRALGK